MDEILSFLNGDPIINATIMCVYYIICIYIYIYITCDILLCLSIYRIQILCFLYIHTAYSFLKPCLD